MRRANAERPSLARRASQRNASSYGAVRRNVTGLRGAVRPRRGFSCSGVGVRVRLMYYILYYVARERKAPPSPKRCAARRSVSAPLGPVGAPAMNCASSRRLIRSTRPACCAVNRPLRIHARIVPGATSATLAALVTERNPSSPPSGGPVLRRIADASSSRSTSRTVSRTSCLNESSTMGDRSALTVAPRCAESGSDEAVGHGFLAYQSWNESFAKVGRAKAGGSSAARGALAPQEDP